MGTLRELHLELFDKRSHILIRDNRTLILLNSKYALWYFYLQVAFHLTLASETPVVLYLFTGEVRLLGIEYLTATFEHLNLALPARRLSSTSRRKEDAVLREC